MNDELAWQQAQDDMHWVYENYAVLLDIYEGQWVAVINKTVVCHAVHMADLKACWDALNADVPFVTYIMPPSNVVWAL